MEMKENVAHKLCTMYDLIGNSKAFPGSKRH